MVAISAVGSTANTYGQQGPVSGSMGNRRVDPWHANKVLKTIVVCMMAFAFLQMFSKVPTAEAGFLCFTLCMSACTAATGGAFAAACVPVCVTACATNPI